MKRVTLTPLNRFLAADAQFASWTARRAREEALLAVVRRALPRPVAGLVFVANGEGATLELATSSGAVATVVRQKGPELLARLAAQGWQFSGIRLRVQPRAGLPEVPKPLPRQWDSASARPLEALRARLPAGPLRAALGRLLKSR